MLVIQSKPVLQWEMSELHSKSNQNLRYSDDLKAYRPVQLILYFSLSDSPVSAQVPDKRWYWLKTCALATVGNWDALEKFSREKRPPGGEFCRYDFVASKLSLY